MKILHIITGLSNGGAEASLYRLTTSDDQNTHQVIVLMDQGVYGERLISAGIPVHTLDMPRGRVTIKGVIELYRLVRLVKPDVVQTWMYHADLIGGVVARLAGAKIVIWGIRGPFDRQRTALQTRITIRLCAFFSKWFPIAIVSNSEHAAEVHVQVGYSPDKLINIPNGYPLNQFLPDETARDELLHELNLKHDIVLIGMVARFDPYKDHENLFGALLAIARKGRQVACLLVGPGMSMTNQPLRHLIEKYGVQEMVKLIGPRDDVPKIMAALDIHVLSSVAESFPNVLAEAMACGTPCVTTDVGDAALIVGDTGWVVTHSDPAVLAHAIQEALDEMKDSANWNARKEACRKRVTDNYSLERMIESYTGIWGDAVNDK
jgi:glycosyltransferase involved in cell wall biosynthesis